MSTHRNVGSRRLGGWPPGPIWNRLGLALLYGVASLVVAIGFAPVAFWFAALGLAIAVYRHDGQWPFYNHPDPGSLPSDLPLGWLEWALPLLVVVSGTAAVQAVLHFRVSKGWWWLIVPAFVGVAWGLGIAFVRLDPFSVMNWYFD